jgi:K+-transporting ATPase ATPase C chain
MFRQFRANLWLVGLTMLLGCVVYPAVLWAIGQTVFPHRAQGSLLTDEKGTVIGSALIAQPFSGEEYFQPRPSAVGYNAAASGASNWAANNYLLRDRVARTLGPIVRSKGQPPHDRSIQEDVVEWFKSKPGIVAEWARAHPRVAQAWVKADDKHRAAVHEWLAAPEAAEVLAVWKKRNPDAGNPDPPDADLAVPFFEAHAKEYHETWPRLISDPSWSVAAVFFDMWLQEHPRAELEEVPADMVMASGSGLDPHITLKSALYQLDRVAPKWSEITRRDAPQLQREIEQMLRDRAEAPLGGLVGVPLINVLDMNLALRDRYRP